MTKQEAKQFQTEVESWDYSKLKNEMSRRQEIGGYAMDTQEYEIMEDVFEKTANPKDKSLYSALGITE